MTLEQTARDLNNLVKKQNDKDQYIKTLEDKIKILEEVLTNLADRVEYLESLCK